MARIRTIKPDFWTDEKVVALSAFARLLFIGMWNFVDDEGRAEFSPMRLKMQILPADPADMSELIGEIRRERLIDVYDVDGKEYFQVTNFAKHQKIDKRAVSKHPPPPIPADLPRIPPTEGKGMEEEGKGDSEAKASGASAVELFTDEDALKQAVYELAGNIKRRSAPTELMKLGMSWAEIYATLATAKTKTDPNSYIAARIRNKDSPQQAITPLGVGG